MYQHAVLLSWDDYWDIDALPCYAYRWSTTEGKVEATIIETTDTLFLIITAEDSVLYESENSFSEFKLHRGMWEAWASIAEAVGTEMLSRRMLDKAEGITKKVVYCGKGVGGALAEIASATHKPDYLVTFDSPPCAAKSMAVRLAGIDCKRFVFEESELPFYRPWFSLQHSIEATYLSGERPTKERKGVPFFKKLSQLFNSAPVHIPPYLITYYLDTPDTLDIEYVEAEPYA